VFHASLHKGHSEAAHIEQWYVTPGDMTFKMYSWRTWIRRSSEWNEL